MFKIMIVEDDPVIKCVLEESIPKWGYEAKSTEDLRDVLAEFASYSPHLVLMDINLPYFDGYHWCSRIRQVSKVPIIFVSSRSHNMDVVMAINMGGDDFIQKPFSMDILMAKINGLIRRAYSYADLETNVIEHKGLVLNLRDNALICNDKKLDLTRNEFKILYLLMKSNGSVISRDSIMRSLWEDESFVDDSTLTVNINRLRKKLDEAGLYDLIQTKKGQGYMIR